MRIFFIILLFAFFLVSCSPVVVENPFATKLPIVTITEQQTTDEPNATREPVATNLSVVTDEPGETADVTEQPVKIVLWATETGDAFQYVQSLASAYTDRHPEVSFEVVNKQIETFREDFQNSSQTGVPPDLLWTVSDHTAYFAAEQLILPVDDLFDLSPYVENALAAVTRNGQRWGVPITNGNHLMLYYNKNLVSTPPADTDELFEIAKRITDPDSGRYGLVFDQTSPIWLVPWLGSFGGGVLAEDGITPTLHTQEMIATLQFLRDLKYIEKVLPADSDSFVSDSLFQEGKAGMIINGDWMLSIYKDVLGDKLGVAPLPRMVASDLWPAPYTTGSFFMLSSGLKGAKLDLVRDFIVFSTSIGNQLEMVNRLGYLPANKKALIDDLITSDPILSASVQQMLYGSPLPTGFEMHCILEAIKIEMQNVLDDKTTPEEAAAAMQSTAESCTKALK